ncbi:pyrroline-5-carboxylate reductase-like [Ylistrum balloti]|uniref:pyrroline-5-carboxylate reductase-like n=1 Tax=Ylistrum balloti TaxID=509963 RepID=UPI002905DFE0|nr:pyrroline-5-carboxylate reductase-like [Ylistrum balloti]
MPNLPSQIAAGSGGFCFSKNISKVDKAKISKIFSVFGHYVEINEKLFDALTSLSGSGPAFVFLFIEALVSAGRRLGLSKQQAMVLAGSTVSGAAQMVLATNEDPIKLVKQVTSPGGMTIEGVNWLEKRKFVDTVGMAIELAYKKSKKLMGE